MSGLSYNYKDWYFIYYGLTRNSSWKTNDGMEFPEGFLLLRIQDRSFWHSDTNRQKARTRTTIVFPIDVKCKVVRSVGSRKQAT